MVYRDELYRSLVHVLVLRTQGYELSSPAFRLHGHHGGPVVTDGGWMRRQPLGLSSELLHLVYSFILQRKRLPKGRHYDRHSAR